MLWLQSWLYILHVAVGCILVLTFTIAWLYSQCTILKQIVPSYAYLKLSITAFLGCILVLKTQIFDDHLQHSYSFLCSQ